MKRCIAVLCLVVLLCAVAVTAAATWAMYKGAWFTVQYPASFKAKGSLKSATSDAGYDSAFFKSRDNLVEFYVYSPQWNGKATDIALKPKTEKETSRLQGTANGVRTIRVTIKAKNGSYTRSYIDTEDQNQNTRLVFAIKYKNQKAYDRYKAVYLKFKSSLKQFAD